MSGPLLTALWLGLVVLGVATMQWGASRAADLLDGLRGKYGLPATAGGALMGLATAAPETAVNVSSVAFGWPDLGLGAALGSNVPALPLAFGLAYLAVRFAPAPTGGGVAPSAPAAGAPSPSPAGEPPAAPVVQPQAVTVHVLPYLGVVLLLGALTLPPPWSGLQPIDGAILVAAFVLYLAHALLRRPWIDRGELEGGAVRRALVGVPAIALGALLSVLGGQKVGAGLGWPDMVVGLFVIGLLCALPEAYSAWRFAREGKPTLAVSSATGDGIVSLTVALLPVALIGAAVGDVAVYLANLVYLGLALSAYAFLNHRRRGQELGSGIVLLFTGGYVAYAVAMAYLLARAS